MLKPVFRYLPIIILSLQLNAQTIYERPIPEKLKDVTLPGFSLTDINQGSASFGKEISMEDYAGQTLLVYFGAVG